MLKSFFSLCVLHSLLDCRVVRNALTTPITYQTEADKKDIPEELIENEIIKIEREYSKNGAYVDLNE